MGDEQKIIIDGAVFTRDELFKEKENFRKERAKLKFEEKIKILVNLQKLACSWGRKKDIILWKME